MIRLLSALFLCISLSCTEIPVEESAPEAGLANGDEEQGTSFQSESETSIPEEHIADKPIGVSGVNLIATYSNAKNRCEYKESTSSMYEVQCHVVIAYNGMEFRATSLDQDLNIDWQNPKVLQGSLDVLTCDVSTNNLNYSCNVEVSASSKLVNLEFAFKKQSEDKPELLETQEVLLAYKVQVINGNIQTLPYQYQLSSKKIPSQKPDRFRNSGSPSGPSLKLQEEEA